MADRSRVYRFSSLFYQPPNLEHPILGGIESENSQGE